MVGSIWYINYINAIKVLESADEIIAKIEDISKTITTIITKPEYVIAVVDTNWWFFTIIAISVIIISILVIIVIIIMLQGPGDDIPNINNIKNVQNFKEIGDYNFEKLYS